MNTVDRESRRQVIRRAEAVNRLPEYIPTVDRSRGEAVSNENIGYQLLRRADGRRYRRLNRTRKPGSDRYRTLDLRTNKRSLRGMEYESSLPLPRTLVQTGGDVERPSRRAVRDNAYYTQVNNRDRNVLEEMKNGQ